MSKGFGINFGMRTPTPGAEASELTSREHGVAWVIMGPWVRYAKNRLDLREEWQAFALAVQSGTRGLSSTKTLEVRYDWMGLVRVLLLLLLVVVVVVVVVSFFPRLVHLIGVSRGPCKGRFTGGFHPSTRHGSKTCNQNLPWKLENFRLI